VVVMAIFQGQPISETSSNIYVIIAEDIRHFGTTALPQSLGFLPLGSDAGLFSSPFCGIHGLRVSFGEFSAESSFLKENGDMAWTLLLVAGFFEIVWATLLKFTDGFTRVWPSIGTVVAMGISMVCLAFALRAIPMGTAYAVWTGIGAVGTVILGIVLFDEPKNAVRLVCLAMIIAGIAGLKLSSTS